jgi:hypothetical protein
MSNRPPSPIGRGAAAGGLTIHAARALRVAVHVLDWAQYQIDPAKYPARGSQPEAEAERATSASE